MPFRLTFPRLFLFAAFMFFLIATITPQVFAQDTSSKEADSQSAIAKPTETQKAKTQQILESQEPAPEKPSAAKENYYGASAALGIPHPINFNFNFVHSSRLFSAEIGGGSYKFKVSGADLEIKNTQIGLHWHPWAGSFFVGALYGTRSLTGEKTDVVSGFNATVKAEITSNYLTPMVGWLWGADDGGFFGSIELGYLMPSAVKTTISTNAPAAVQTTTSYQDLETDVKNTGKKAGEMGLPHITLVKLGWLF